MKLPLYDEVREARRLAEEADRAVTLATRCDTMVTAMAVLGQQLASLDPEGVDLPGQDIIDEAVEQFPFCAPARDLPLREGADLIQRLQHRRQQVQTIRQLLQPIVGDQQRRAQHLHQLQHQQAHHLHEPDYDELRQGIEEHNEVRMEAQMRLGPLANQRQVLQPIRQTLSGFLPQAREELARADTSALDAAMARERIASIVETIAGACTIFDFPVAVPDAARVRDLDADHVELASVIEQLEVLQRAADGEAERLDQALEHEQERLETSTRWILDRTG